MFTITPLAGEPLALLRNEDELENYLAREATYGTNELLSWHYSEDDASQVVAIFKPLHGDTPEELESFEVRYTVKVLEDDGRVDPVALSIKARLEPRELSKFLAHLRAFSPESASWRVIPTRDGYEVVSVSSTGFITTSVNLC
jgi:hypothetical protein